MAEKRCRICDNETKNRFFTAKEMMFGFRDTFDYFECSTCGCLQILEIPRNISKYYPVEYYSYSNLELLDSRSLFSRLDRFLTKQANGFAVFSRGFFGKLMYRLRPDDRFRSLSMVPKLTKQSRILDVGCGSGNLLFGLSQLGFSNLLGIDKYVDKDVVYRGGLKIQKGILEDIVGFWDVIMFHHSFEHMENPLATLRVASNLLAEGGVCLINIPTVSSYAWKHYGTAWVQLDAPRHLFLHSIKSLGILGEEANLALCGVSYNSVAFQFWGSEQYLKDIPLNSDRSYSRNPANSGFTKAQIRAFEQKARELNRKNQGDSAVFCFRKRE